MSGRDFRFQRSAVFVQIDSWAAMKYSHLAILLTCLVKSYLSEDKMEIQLTKSFNLISTVGSNCTSSTFGVIWGWVWD